MALVAQRVLSERLRDLRKAMRGVGRVLGAEGIRGGQDQDGVAAKAVHRLRVASRKSDVALRTFRAYCPPKQWRQVRATVRNVSRLAGAVRGPPATAAGPAVASPAATSHASRPRPRAPASGAAGRRAASPVDVEGVGDLPVTLARCCSPSSCPMW